jgi:hypothetical protein
MRTCLHKLALGCCLTACLAAFATEPSGTGNAASEGVELKTIRYRDLCAAVRAQLGKVVVVDIWGEY